MGMDFEERAFIEMADRRAELNLLLSVAHWARHTHPALAHMENPQFPEYGLSQRDKLLEIAGLLDATLARQPYVAGERFTVADITAFCALEFARPMIKFKPEAEGFAHLQAYRDRIAARPSAAAK